MLTITEPRTVAVASLPDYVGWRLAPELSAGAMIQGTILAARPLDGDDSAMVITLDSRDGHGRPMTADYVLTTWRPDFYRGTNEPRYVEVARAHTVPDSVPGANDSERYARIFDYVDAHGVSIADAIAALA